MEITELAHLIAQDIVRDTETRPGDKETDLFVWRGIISKHMNENHHLLPQGRVLRAGPARFRPLGADRGLMRSRVEHCADLTAKDLIADCYKDIGHEYAEDDLTHWTQIVLAGVAKYLQ
jgi:hypothetical protein